MEIGTVCTKLAGRETGEKVVVIDNIDKNFVVIAGPNVKRRRCNLRHLRPLEKSLDIKQGASAEEVNKALRAAFPEEAKPAPPKKVEKKPKEKAAKVPKKKARKEGK
jgi:large subunit ribosomal protein L14e